MLMLRLERLCKAKDVDNGEWVEGYYIHLHKTTYCFAGEGGKSNEIHRLVHEHMVDWGLPNKHLMTDIDPDTLCRCTGMEANGKLLYEFDKVLCKIENKIVRGVILYYRGAYWVRSETDMAEPKLLSYYVENGEVEYKGYTYD